MIAARIIGKTITGRILGGVVLLVAILIVLLVLSRCSNAELQRELGALGQSAAQCAEDNTHQTTRLNQCVEGFSALADRLRVEQDANLEAVLAAERRARQRELDRLSEQAARDRIYSTDPSCEQWAEIRVCDDIAARLLESRRALIDRYLDEIDE